MICRMVLMTEMIIPLMLVNRQRAFKMFAYGCVFREEWYLDLPSGP